MKNNLDLNYFVEWRPLFWAPAVKKLLGDPERFKGKRVLELGSSSGRMSCLLGLLGANVVGVDLDDVSLERAWAEVDRWNLRDKVSFATYNGNPLDIPGGDYDYVFTKSVFVIVPELSLFLSMLSKKLKQNCELMMAENLAGGRFFNLVRRFIVHRHDKDYTKRYHHFVDSDFLALVRQTYNVIEFTKYYGIVAAIRARKM